MSGSEGVYCDMWDESELSIMGSGMASPVTPQHSRYCVSLLLRLEQRSCISGC